MDNYMYYINLVLFWGCIIYGLKALHDKNKIDLIKVNNEAVIDLNTPEILSNLITEIFAEYIALNIEYKDTSYMGDDIEITLLKEISKLVEKRLADLMYYKLTMFYSNETLSDTIADKVYLMVIDYVNSKNKDIQDT